MDLKIFDREEMSIKTPFHSLKTVVGNCLTLTALLSLQACHDVKHWRPKKRHRYPRPRFECQYCNEWKRDPAFVLWGALPYDCQRHLSGDKQVCKSCMDLALGTQLEFKPLLEVGCPECGTPWDPEEVRGLISMKTQMRFIEMEKMAKGQPLRPVELPDGATIETLLQAGTRFCPWCRWPFVKAGGCDAMVCLKCNKYFDIKYALVLEDEQGRRAAKIVEYDDSNDQEY